MLVAVIGSRFYVRQTCAYGPCCSHQSCKGGQKVEGKLGANKKDEVTADEIEAFSVERNRQFGRGREIFQLPILHSSLNCYPELLVCG
jgi:hypothetical protein